MYLLPGKDSARRDIKMMNNLTDPMVKALRGHPHKKLWGALVCLILVFINRLLLGRVSSNVQSPTLHFFHFTFAFLEDSTIFVD